MVLCIKLKDSLKIKPHPFLVEDASEKIVAWPGDTAGILFGSVYIGTLLYCSSGCITTHRLINARPLTMETVSTKGHT